MEKDVLIKLFEKIELADCKLLTNQKDLRNKYKKKLMAWHFDPSKVFLVTKCIYLLHNQKYI